MSFSKSLSLLLLLFVSTVAAKAQGNLQFNQVINIDLIGSSPATNEVVFQTQTVSIPAGKVWKVETASCRLAFNPQESYVNGAATNNRILITIDNSPLSFYQTSQVAGIVTNGQTMTPLWLPSGSHTFVLRAAAGTPNTAYGKISIIEFNIVP